MGKLKDFLFINIGLVFVAVGIYLFKVPNSFATGGVSGLAIIFNYFSPGMSVGPIMMIINAVLLVLGFLVLGSNFGSKTVYSSFALSGMVWILEKTYPMTHPLTNDTLLELIYSILLPAIGSAIVFNLNASTGGTDIVAKILNKLTNLHIGKTLLMADFLIVLAAGLVFGIKIGMYSLLGLILKGFLIDLVIEGMNVSKQVVVISEKPGEVKRYIIDRLHRGATVYKAYGAYSNEEKEVITSVLSRREAIKLRNFVREVDNRSFITITNTSEIVGKGFRTIDL